MRSGYKKSIVWQQGVRRLPNFAGYSLVILGGFGFGLFLMWAIAYFGRGGENPVTFWISLGTILGLSLGILCHGIVDTLTFVTEFNLAVSMGVTRRRLWLGYVLSGVLELTALSLEVAALSVAERALAKVLFGGLSPAEEMSGFWGGLLPAMAAGILPLLSAELCLGAMVLRFGNRVLWVPWVLMMSFPIQSGGWGNLVHRIGQIARQLGGEHLGEILWGAGILLTLLLTAVSIALVRKQRVTLG